MSLGNGGGKYEDECKTARESTGGVVMLIVLGGKKGHGHEFQMRVRGKHEVPPILATLAPYLRLIADELDESRERVERELLSGDWQ